jgi:hypothetical protein
MSSCRVERRAAAGYFAWGCFRYFGDALAIEPAAYFFSLTGTV